MKPSLALFVPWQTLEYTKHVALETSDTTTIELWSTLHIRLLSIISRDRVRAALLRIKWFEYFSLVNMNVAMQFVRYFVYHCGRQSYWSTPRIHLTRMWVKLHYRWTRWIILSFLLDEMLASTICLHYMHNVSDMDSIIQSNSTYFDHFSSINCMTVTQGVLPERDNW